MFMDKKEKCSCAWCIGNPLAYYCTKKKPITLGLMSQDDINKAKILIEENKKK